MKKLALLVAVAISTAVVAQRPLRKVIVETSSAEFYTGGSITIDSVYRDYTNCEVQTFVDLGFDTSTLDMFWDYDIEFFDTLTYAYTSPEQYVFDLRKGVITYSNGSTRKKIKIRGFSYTGPEKYTEDISTEGSIMVFTTNEKGESESYSIYFDSNSFTYYPATDIFTAESKRKEYKVSKVTKK
jgi:hypothetical protein